ncbi:MAG: hypothetical protein JWM84_234 [Nocardioides sp.]|nr:hypothetical protein [Nocardioides sp.]
MGTLDQRARLRRRDWLEDILGDVAQGTCSVLERGYLDLVVLDGRLFHDSTRARDRDLERDLDAATYGDQTLRLGYAQVFERGCSTAVKVAGVLQRHGWSGQVGRCGACP